MVQIKTITDNFITKRYLQFSRKPFSSLSFKSGIAGYLTLIGFVLISQWSGNKIHFFTEETNRFLTTQIKFLFGVVVLNIIGFICFDTLKLKKYMVLVSYISGMLFPFCLLAFLACTTKNPIKNTIYGSLILFTGWIIGVIVHILLVKLSLKKGTMKIRDMYGDYFTNISSGLGMISLFYGFARDEDVFLQVGFLLIMVALLIVGTFNFPRILPYWRKEQSKKDISVYSDSIKLMKRGKSK
ncbi:hypothetical protein [Enterococcus gilvus]|uniref:hypothetical protein n=1 Tax=Enterococcus gilvus TaxID=160453 RepID=UPI001C8C0CFF|nr:hypothetical protein [Enterococcus gilvus]MBX8935595.1 hypothetical protein [Enterococcus gilvus]